MVAVDVVTALWMASIDVDIVVSGPQWCVIVTVIMGAIACRRTSARANRAGRDPPVRQVCVSVCFIRVYPI